MAAPGLVALTGLGLAVTVPLGRAPLLGARAFVLALLYVLPMSGLGALAGLLVMVRRQPRTAARRRKAPA